MEQGIHKVATIHTGFREKFGIPRQSGLVPGALATIVFEPAYRNPDGIKGMEEFSHLWLIWGFSKVDPKREGLTVAPPRLGGKLRKGVFATRSPFRPNRLGLSSVELLEIKMDEQLGPVLVVAGADLLDGTPIYDIKPYLAYTDCHPNARCGFAQEHQNDELQVIFPEEYRKLLGEEKYLTIRDILAQDPRAAYNKAPDYVYGMTYGEYDIRFVVTNEILSVKEILRRDDDAWKKVK